MKQYPYPEFPRYGEEIRLPADVLQHSCADISSSYARVHIPEGRTAAGAGKLKLHFGLRKARRCGVFPSVNAQKRGG